MQANSAVYEGSGTIVPDTTNAPVLKPEPTIHGCATPLITSLLAPPSFGLP